jgi:hypothetical protein
MSAKGSRRSAGISLTTAQRTAEISAACYDELPQRDSSAAAEIGVNQPFEAIGAAEAPKSTHKKAPFRHFQTSALPVTPPERDGLSSLSYVSFLDREIYFSHLREGLINVSQTLAILLKAAPRSWHSATAQRRTSIATKARSERRLLAPPSRARLSHEQREASSSQSLARDDGPTGHPEMTRQTEPRAIDCLILRAALTCAAAPNSRPKPSIQPSPSRARLSHYSMKDRRRETLAMLCSLLC